MCCIAWVALVKLDAGVVELGAGRVEQWAARLTGWERERNELLPLNRCICEGSWVCYEIRALRP